MLLLALQFYEGDLDAALDLAKLIADIEPTFNKNAEFLLFARKDVPDHYEPRIKDAVHYLSQKFKTHYKRSTRGGVGWPAGCNNQWHCLIQQVCGMSRDKQTDCKAMLTFESDCAPTSKDWIARLYNEWAQGGKIVCGAVWESPNVWEHHVNGNLICDIQIAFKLPSLTGTPDNATWDGYHSKTLLPQTHASKLIYNDYKTKEMTEERMFSPRKDGLIPGMIHGIKDDSGRRLAREKLVG